MNIVIVANGEEFKNDTFMQKVKQADCIIAADGGIYNCLENNITPDYIVGDIDSFENIMSQVSQKTKVIHISEQETTDMQKAIAYAETLNPDFIDIFCAFGKRTDHTLGNLFILNNYDKLRLTMYDEAGNFKMLKSGTHFFKGKKGTTLSLFCTEIIRQIELKGFKYPLSKETIGPVFIGISNVITENIASIKFDVGRLLVYELNN